VSVAKFDNNVDIMLDDSPLDFVQSDDEQTSSLRCETLVSSKVESCGKCPSDSSWSGGFETVRESGLGHACNVTAQ
jgi:hypothetical protein